MVGALGRHEALAVHDEFVPLCLAAKDGMVFQYQAGCLRRVLLKVQRGGQTAKSATDNGEIEDFACFLSLVGRVSEDMVPDLVTGGHHLKGVAVRFGVVTDAAVAGPVIF